MQAKANTDIINSDQQELSPDEKNILWRLRNKKTLFIIGAYLSLSFVFIDGWTRVYPSTYLDAIRELFRFRYYPTWYLLFLFIILTIYFTRYFLKSVYPLFKDLRNGTKQVIYFVPGRYQTPYFAEYYLKTPFQKVPLIRIEKEMYDSIQSDSRGCINMALYSRFVFSIEVNGMKEIFNYSIAFDDI